MRMLEGSKAKVVVHGLNLGLLVLVLEFLAYHLQLTCDLRGGPSQEAVMFSSGFLTHDQPAS